MKVSREDILHVAKLSALSLSEAEVERLSVDISTILDYVELLNEAPVDGVPPTYHVHNNNNVIREDSVEESLSPDAISVNAPDFFKGGFRIPKVI